MAQLLSRDEVDALQQGIANVPAPAQATGSPQEVPGSPDRSHLQSVPSYIRPYDFTRSEISTRGRLPGLEVIFSNFARRLQRMFATQLGKSVDAGFAGVEVVSYEALIQSLPLPASIHAIRLDPLRGMGILVLDARLAFAMIELFFGGSGQKDMKVEGRDFTLIESAFLSKFIERMLKGMEESWQSVIQIKGRYLRSEINPYLLNVANMGDPMISVTYSVNMPPITGTVLFSLPLAAIEDLRDQLKSRVLRDDQLENVGLSKRLQQAAMDVDLEVQAVIDVIEMSLGEIMGIQPGDVIQLNAPGLHQIELWIEGRRKFFGKAAQHNGNKVFVMTKHTG